MGIIKFIKISDKEAAIASWEPLKLIIAKFSAKGYNAGINKDLPNILDVVLLCIRIIGVFYIDTKKQNPPFGRVLDLFGAS